MVTPFAIYLILQLDSIYHLLLVMLAISLVCFGFFFIPSVFGIMDDDIKLYQRAKPYLKITGSLMIICILLVTFIPSTKTAIAMYTIPDVLNNKKVQAIPDKALDLINQKLDEFLKHSKEK